MRGPPPRYVAIIVILAITVMLVRQILFGGPDPETGKCVDGAGALVGCDEAKALYKLVREVDEGRECPSESQKLYQFRSSLYCGVALKGAPAPSAEYVPCLLLAGAELARRPQDLAFARDAAARRGQPIGSGRRRLQGPRRRTGASSTSSSKASSTRACSAIVAEPGQGPLRRLHHAGLRASQGDRRRHALRRRRATHRPRRRYSRLPCASKRSGPSIACDLRLAARARLEARAGRRVGEVPRRARPLDAERRRSSAPPSVAQPHAQEVLVVGDRLAR